MNEVSYFYRCDIPVPAKALEMDLTDRQMLLVHLISRLHRYYPEDEWFLLEKSDVFLMLNKGNILRWGVFMQTFDPILEMGNMPNDKVLCRINPHIWKPGQKLRSYNLTDKLTIYMYRKLRGLFPMGKVGQRFKGYDMTCDLIKMLDKAQNDV